MTPEQIAARRQGYLDAGQMTPTQSAALVKLAQQYGFVDSRGKPKDAGTHLALGLSRGYRVLVCDWGAGRALPPLVQSVLPPPSPYAIASAPLAGSVLWRMWQYADAKWGDRPVSLPPKTYRVSDLAPVLSAAVGVPVRPDARAAGKELAIVAREIPARRLLWAIAVAGALDVRALPAKDPEIIYLGSPAAPPLHALETDASVLLYWPGLGYPCPPCYPPVKAFLDADEDGRDLGPERAMGWRFDKLPMLFRDVASGAAKGSVEPSVAPRGSAPGPAGAAGYPVYWVQVLVVSVDLVAADGSGGGVEIVLPAL